MDLKKAEKFLSKRIEELEKMNYMFESLVKPRAERDKEILEKMRAQYLKLQALMKRQSEGEEISADEFYDAVPEELR